MKPHMAVTVDAITVAYNGVTALDDFSIEVEPGEIMAVVGPSGSGKSTLLRAIAGLEPLVTGTISLGGTDLAGVATHQRNLGLMFQDHGLFAHLNVADNIGYGLKTAGVDKEARLAQVGELLDLVGLAGFERRGTAELSGGEAQRVALARALAPKPGLLMLDEPLGSLDRALREQLTGELRRLLSEIGQTALHVTHDQAEAFALADKVVVVSEGKPVAIGTPADLWHRPASRFVAEFLGHPNLWTVRVRDDGALWWEDQHLGNLAAGHLLRADAGGERQVVVPTTAIVISEPQNGDPGSSALAVMVMESVFRAGLYDVTAAVLGVNGDETAKSVAFTTDRKVTKGQRLSLAVDVDLAVQIDG